MQDKLRLLNVVRVTPSERAAAFKEEELLKQDDQTKQNDLRTPASHEKDLKDNSNFTKR